MSSRLTSVGKAGLLPLATPVLLAILASCGADAATSPLPGPPPAVASVHVSATNPVTSPLVFTDWRRHYSAIATDSTGEIVNGVPASWTSSDSAVATVMSDGTVIPRRFGEADLTAWVSGTRGTAHVSVYALVDTSLMIIAHRGFASVFPENTLAAIQGAYDLGADGVETDVRLTRDGVPIIMHDETVDRTTNGTGAVARLTLEQIRRLDACSKFRTTWEPCMVPTLEEVLNVARGRTKLLLHLQGAYPPTGLREVARMISQAQLGDQVIIIDFDHDQLRQLHALDPSLAIGFLYTAVPPFDQLPSGYPDAVLLPADSLLAMGSAAGHYYVRSAKALGVDVAVWTVDSPTEARALLALGNVRIVTDLPLDRAQIK